MKFISSNKQGSSTLSYSGTSANNNYGIDANSDGNSASKNPLEKFLAQYTKTGDLEMVKVMLKNKTQYALKMSEDIKCLRESFCKSDLEYKKLLTDSPDESKFIGLL